METVKKHGGLHLRELQRQLGITWGLCDFHVRALVEIGFLKIRREGRYAVVQLVGGPSGAAALPHPVSRSIYSAIPIDGAPITSAAVCEALGLSRQIVDYHLQALARRDLIDVSGRGARKEIARKPSPPPILAPQARLPGPEMRSRGGSPQRMLEMSRRLKISDIERIENTAAAIYCPVYTDADSLLCASYRTATKVISAAACTAEFAA